VQRQAADGGGGCTAAESFLRCGGAAAEVAGDLLQCGGRRAAADGGPRRTPGGCGCGGGRWEDAVADGGSALGQPDGVDGCGGALGLGGSRAN